MKSASASWVPTSGTGVLHRLGGGQRPGQPRGGHHPAQPQARRQALARGADVQHPLGRQALERAAPGAVVTQLGVVVVFDHQTLVALGPLDQRRAPLGAHHGSRRELVRGRDHHRRDVGGGQCVHLQPGGVDRHRNHLEARLLERQPVRVPARLLDAHALDSLLGQPPRHQREGLAKPGGDQQVLGVHGGAAGAPEVVGQRVAQLGQPARVRVPQGVDRRGPPRGPHGPQPGVSGEPGQVGPAGREVVRGARRQRLWRGPARRRCARRWPP